jgi:integrase/recombinase XerD
MTKENKSNRQRFTKIVGNPQDAKGLYCAMRRFVEHRAVEGGTEAGLYSLERYIRDFIGWADARSVTHPEHVSQAVLERYQRHLYYYRKKDGAALSIASRRAKIVPLRSFFKWLTRSGQIPANPAAEIDLPKKIRRLPRHVLTVGEVERVMAIADITTPIGLRDRAMMEVLYGTGMRRMEIANLEVGDIDIDKGVVLIRLGKGSKDRLIPLGERALHWVQTYLDKSRPQLTWNQQEKTLFLSREGGLLNYAWLSTQIAQYVKRAQLGKQGGCHLFRHTMATLMLEGGADIRFIQVMLGHAEMSTTQIYTQVAIRQLQLVHAKTHPGARRRAQSSADVPDGSKSAITTNDSAAALFAALDAEQEDEQQDNATHNQARTT